MLLIGQKNFFSSTKSKIPFHRFMLLTILMVEKVLEFVMENKLQKTNKKEFIIEKTTKRKKISYMLKIES